MSYSLGLQGTPGIIWGGGEIVCESLYPCSFPQSVVIIFLSDRTDMRFRFTF